MEIAALLMSRSHQCGFATTEMRARHCLMGRVWNLPCDRRHRWQHPDQAKRQIVLIHASQPRDLSQNMLGHLRSRLA